MNIAPSVSGEDLAINIIRPTRIFESRLHRGLRLPAARGSLAPARRESGESQRQGRSQRYLGNPPGSARRIESHRYIRSQTRLSVQVPQHLQADPDQRPRPANLRAPAAHRETGGQIRGDPLDDPQVLSPWRRFDADADGPRRASDRPKTKPFSRILLRELDAPRPRLCKRLWAATCEECKKFTSCSTAGLTISKAAE